MIGGGLDISFMRLQLSQRADLSRQVIPGTNLAFAQLGVPPLTDFADVRLEGRSVQVGFHLGLLIKPHERWAVGARYLSRQKVDTTEGEFTSRQIDTGMRTPVPLPGVPPGTPLDALLASQFATGGRLESGQAVTTSLYLPDQFVVGMMVRTTDRMKVKVDYQLTNWSLFEILKLETTNGNTQTLYESYRDTHGVRVGTEITAGPRTALRAGILAHTAAAPDDTATPFCPRDRGWSSPRDSDAGSQSACRSTSPTSICISAISAGVPETADWSVRRRP